jgi:hypothetical protein
VPRDPQDPLAALPMRNATPVHHTVEFSSPWWQKIESY